MRVPPADIGKRIPKHRFTTEYVDLALCRFRLGDGRLEKAIVVLDLATFVRHEDHCHPAIPRQEAAMQHDCLSQCLAHHFATSDVNGNRVDRLANQLSVARRLLRVNLKASTEAGNGSPQRIAVACPHNAQLVINVRHPITYFALVVFHAVGLVKDPNDK